jgi:predicted enzyme related to lactoylglutathione lyase
MGVLTNAPAVMLWRRVSNLDAASKLATKTLTWPKVGSNQYAVISDGGNLLLGQWVPAQLTAAGGACSTLDLLKIDWVTNPAVQLVTASKNLAPALTQLRALTKTAVKPAGQSSVSFVDNDGNFTLLTKATQWTGRSARKVTSLLQTAAGVAKQQSNVAVGFEFLVTNLKASTTFYKNVLGLNLLESTKASVAFDLGNVILTLKQEPAVGLIKSLNRSGRLQADWIVFQVKDIEESVKALKAKGVKFPKGIEDSAHGRGAYFNDPDGFSFGLWLPPTKPDAINYFAQLHRIVSTTNWLA